MNLSIFSKSDKIVEYKDPFQKGMVYHVNIDLYSTTSIFRENKKHKAVVYLRNGNTEGEQTFYDDDYNSLMTRIHSFIESL